MTRSTHALHTVLALTSSLVTALSATACGYSGKTSDRAPVSSTREDTSPAKPSEGAIDFKRFLDPTPDEIREATQDEDILKPLASYPGVVTGTSDSRLSLEGGLEVVVKSTLKRAAFLPMAFGGLRPYNLDEDMLRFYQSYAEARVGTVEEATFKALAAHYGTAETLKWEKGRDYALVDFLPPMMQSFTNARGLGSLVDCFDCFATAYAKLADTRVGHFLSRQGGDFGFEDATKFTSLGTLDPTDAAGTRAFLSKLRFGDVLVWGGHITTIVTPDLSWEMSNGGTASFRLVDVRRVIGFWSDPADAVTFPKAYRPSASLRFEKQAEKKTFHPLFGEHVEKATIFPLQARANGTWTVKK